MNRQLPTGIYIHIPFCVRKCLYCDFNSYAGKEALFESYVEALRAEIRLGAAQYPDAGISTVYFGGGTPTVLPPERLADIVNEVRESFHVAPDAEITVEANPGVSGASRQSDLTPDPSPKQGVEALLLPPFRGQAGRGVGTIRTPQSALRNLFNRLSLGIQSLCDDELRLLGRPHTSEEAVRAFSDARRAGFQNISLDLMYGIPGQTPESWRRTLDGVLQLGPEHVSLYSLTVEEGTPFFAMRAAGQLSLPDEDAEADMYEEAIRTLTAAGFEHYEISNFAKPGFECRHNVIYWRNQPYFGFGAGATSYLEGVRATNIPTVEEYIRRIQAGKDTTATEECLAGRRAKGETMFLGLRMLRGVDERVFSERYGTAPQTVFHEEIEELVSRGLLESENGSLRLTRTGLLFADDVFAQFVG